MDGDFIPLEGTPVPSKKERKEKVNHTLFVSSLPYTATSTDLLTHFSFIGPVRHGFIATDKESGKSKGVGYVTYSLREDAERALEELNNKSFGGGNRKIKIIFADEKMSLKERKAEIKVSKPIPGQTDNKGPSDPNAIRTLVLSGLPAGITKAVLWKKIRKTNDKAEVVYPVEAEEGEEKPAEDVAQVLFPTHGDALKALPKLHGHTYKGAVLSCVLKKRLERFSSKGDGKANSHAGRLIVRNLSWDTTVQDLRKSFLPFGPIHSIDLPTLPSKLPPSDDPSKPLPPPRARGFAFVWFMTKLDAEKAIEGVNGKVLKQPKEGEGRVVAVDWALSKEKWQEAIKDEKKEEKEESGSESSSSGSGSDEESGSEEDSDEEESGEESGSGSEEEEEEEPVKPTLPAVDVGSTLFIRNLPFETTEQELTELFRSFGPLRYARITMDKMTGRSRGTGFVCFWKTEHAEAAIEESLRVAQETGANNIPLGGGPSKNPFALPSLLTVDPSSSLASRLVLHGRTLEITHAVTRETATQMKEDGERSRNAADKRNTYLMREGVIFPNSPAAEGLPEAEVEKRQASFNSRKTLLRGNPSLYISKTRLSIRQLPLFASDRTLKRLAIHAVREFDKEVAEGNREGLARAEEMDDTMSATLEGKDKKKGKSKKERDTVVIQSKIIRQTEKLDPVTGQGRSKGYGFLELRTHKDALKVLRWANNNPEVGPLMWEWWKLELKDLKERAEKGLVEARKREEEEKKAASDGKMEKQSKKVLESAEDLEARLKKLDNRLQEGDDRSGGGMRAGKTLIMEFSIENVQVVKRRVEKIVTQRGEARDDRGGRERGGRERDGRDGNKRKPGVIAAEDSDDDEAPRAKRSKPDDSWKKDTPGGGKFAKRDAPTGKYDKKDRSGGKFEKKGGKFDRNDRPGKFDKRDRPGQVQPRQAGRRGEEKSVDQVKQAVKASEAGEKRGIEKLGSQLGSMIGRKRKLRKGGK
ncbi:hypothetical protein L202_06385 [Cryptococcus amylolentus CBS 6039]|uniref:RRM domain-containing protein n=1 Tax=Cryptococcus amylolentus CBS 6039 TaxID=1295533 RepID=A0A1E3HFT3_9TREE|nr:hypothetical protein L202_06385 [Cryptococcus amylolentus CBS 6039]ODN75187.1 hypothetical protein L202_06385 [Cryptococcus amylolentus CBS 6039]